MLVSIGFNRRKSYSANRLDVLSSSYLCPILNFFVATCTKLVMACMSGLGALQQYAVGKKQNKSCLWYSNNDCNCPY